jgi:hypothetical protein
MPSATIGEATDASANTQIAARSLEVCCEIYALRLQSEHGI